MFWILDSRNAAHSSMDDRSRARKPDALCVEDAPPPLTGSSTSNPVGGTFSPPSSEQAARPPAADRRKMLQGLMEHRDAYVTKEDADRALEEIVQERENLELVLVGVREIRNLLNTIFPGEPLPAQVQLLMNYDRGAAEKKISSIKALEIEIREREEMWVRVNGVFESVRATPSRKRRLPLPDEVENPAKRS